MRTESEAMVSQEEAPTMISLPVDKKTQSHVHKLNIGKS